MRQGLIEMRNDSMRVHENPQLVARNFKRNIFTLVGWSYARLFSVIACLPSLPSASLQSSMGVNTVAGLGLALNLST